MDIAINALSLVIMATSFFQLKTVTSTLMSEMTTFTGHSNVLDSIFHFEGLLWSFRGMATLTSTLSFSFARDGLKLLW